MLLVLGWFVPEIYKQLLVSDRTRSERKENSVGTVQPAHGPRCRPDWFRQAAASGPLLLLYMYSFLARRRCGPVVQARLVGGFLANIVLKKALTYFDECFKWYFCIQQTFPNSTLSSGWSLPPPVSVSFQQELSIYHSMKIRATQLCICWK